MGKVSTHRQCGDQGIDLELCGKRTAKPGHPILISLQNTPPIKLEMKY
jgi:hypothetical protein